MNTTSTIKVTFLDEQGNKVPLLKNQLLSIEFRSKWFIGASRQRCEYIRNDIQVQLRFITFENITLDSDGKFNYNFTITKMGDITIIVSINTQGYTWNEYYNDQYLFFNLAFGK